MGNGEWGMGNGKWGMGNGEWGIGIAAGCEGIIMPQQIASAVGNERKWERKEGEGRGGEGERNREGGRRGRINTAERKDERDGGQNGHCEGGRKAIFARVKERKRKGGRKWEEREIFEKGNMGRGVPVGILM